MRKSYEQSWCRVVRHLVLVGALKVEGGKIPCLAKTYSLTRGLILGRSLVLGGGDPPHVTVGSVEVGGRWCAGGEGGGMTHKSVLTVRPHALAAADSMVLVVRWFSPNFTFRALFNVSLFCCSGSWGGGLGNTRVKAGGCPEDFFFFCIRDCLRGRGVSSAWLRVRLPWMELPFFLRVSDATILV